MLQHVLIELSIAFNMKIRDCVVNAIRIHYLLVPGIVIVLVKLQSLIVKHV